MLRYGILGPLEVWRGDEPVELGGGRQRALLALLPLHANEVVGSDRLIDELWGESPPPTATKPRDVWRLNPVTGRPQAIIPVGGGRGLWDVSAGASSVWVTNGERGTVTRIDPRTNRVSATIETGLRPRGVAPGAGGVWVAIADEEALGLKSR